MTPLEVVEAAFPEDQCDFTVMTTYSLGPHNWNPGIITPNAYGFVPRPDQFPPVG